MKTISEERYKELIHIANDLSKEAVYMASNKCHSRDCNNAYNFHKLVASNEIINVLQNRSNLTDAELNIVYLNLILPARKVFIDNFFECCKKVDDFSTMNVDEIKHAYNNLYLKCNKYKNSWGKVILLLSNIYTLEKNIIIGKIEETFMFHPIFNSKIGKEIDSKKSLSLR